MTMDSGDTSVHGYCTEMPDAVGLYPGNPVTQMGYKVGAVDRIASRGDHVEVTYTLDSGRKFPADIKTVTRSKSLLADRSLELVGDYSSGPTLRPGTCTALDHSFTPKSISEITGSASNFLAAVAPSNGKESVQNSLTGLDAALRGNGADAAGLMRHAASAMNSPDQMLSNMGTSIMNMAPLTEETLQRWSELRSLLDQLPGVLPAAGNDLLPGAAKVTVGTGYLLNVLWDIQQNYGDLIWPTVHLGVTPLVHLAATQAKDIAGLLDVIPPIAAFMRQQSNSRTGGLAITYAPPTVQLGPGTHPPTTSLLDLVLAKKEGR
ncbi:MAG: MCE family protein [Mycobacterium sp.]|nr:MCE family protein [Mycobacterium sp.]